MKVDTIRVRVSAPHPCSYFPDREATTVFLDDENGPGPDVYTALVANGFRRSGNIVYRPACRGCGDCIATRVPVRPFLPNRSQRRAWNANLDLAAEKEPAAFREEDYLLFSRYLDRRHPEEGGMAGSSPGQYMGFLSSGWSRTWFCRFREETRLVALAVVDELTHGLSAVYTFFDPDRPKRSLGVFTILWTIEQARRQNLDWVYLGFWIEDCRKMSYKQAYLPQEQFRQGTWIPRGRRE